MDSLKPTVRTIMWHSSVFFPLTTDWLLKYINHLWWCHPKRSISARRLRISCRGQCKGDSKAIGIYKHHLQILVNDPFPGVHHQQILQIKLWPTFGYGAYTLISRRRWEIVTKPVYKIISEIYLNLNQSRNRRREYYILLVETEQRIHIVERKISSCLRCGQTQPGLFLVLVAKRLT
jgi:hypothetical protein